MSTLFPLEVLREQALQWLSSHSGWLLVLDNVTESADVRPLIASVPVGRFLITTRRATGWHGIATPVRLDVLAQGDAAELLAQIITHAAAPVTWTVPTNLPQNSAASRWLSSKLVPISPRQG